MAEALDATEGATQAFESLSPSNRRELLRFIDDARTPPTRERRVRQTIDHVLGRPGASPKLRTDRPLWTCPKCGNRFVTKNQYHSCHAYTLDTPFAGKPEHIRSLFDQLRTRVEACGPVTLVPYRDQVGFMVRVRFAAAVPKNRWLDVGLFLRRRIDDRRFHRVETLDPNTHVHLMRITSADQLDDTVSGWLAEAYAVGRQDSSAATG